MNFSVNAQNSIKFNKQKTDFYYLQLNLHGGFMSDINGERYDIANRGSANQVVFQWRNIYKRNLQKGYTRSINYKGFKVRGGVSYNKSVDASGMRYGGLKLKIFDTFLNFGSKWDRTSFQIGVKSIPFGHNPKLDPVSSFMTNLIKMDLGVVQDLGFFYKTPLTSNIDLEMAVTSGGVLNKPFVVCENLINYDDVPDNTTTVRLNEFNYDGTWLTTGRIGHPSFKKSELGFVFGAGKLYNTNVQNDLVNIVRVGGDWVFKSGEQFKFSSLITVGKTKSELEGTFNSMNLQTTLDLYLIRKFVISGSFAFNNLEHTSEDVFHKNNTSALSLTYTLTPHTRLRLNSYYTYVTEASEVQYGTFLQLATGIGER